MENATKALLMIGSILLAILILSLIVLLMNNLQVIRTSESEKTFREQLTAFNMQYEAYNKKIMYGTDIISVVNKAIDNNNAMNLQNGTVYADLPRGYVNIKITTLDSFYTTVERYNEDDPYPRREGEDEGINVSHLNSVLSSNHISTVVSDARINVGTYNMGTWTGDHETLIIDSRFKEFFASAREDYAFESLKARDERYVEHPYTYYVHSALTNFKRAVFTCDRVTYDSNSKICELEFRQVRQTI